ncbi:TolC family protein [Geobacter argillaceus]|uniref:Cobalt-zinc-cadmium efflux system outer membrane protein n=1 Tax=Geobacter argillaceus TaxID=345631 RepID=A0A562WQD7_9BACT|nr:TolC family protein [Geobacter argillaceus]TWJ32553.1 cobalt-zinc-cadmium efflux system outer membrane protein [Geobacter argillaceus]
MYRLPQRKIALTVTLAFLLLPAAHALAETAPAPTQAPPPAASPPHKVTFHDYLTAVEQNSLDLQNQRENVTSAKAGISIAGVRPDPQLTAGIASLELNPSNRDNAALATTAGLAITVETAGKRGKRIRAAQSNVKLTEANVRAFVRDLGTQSAAAFVEACRTRDALARKESSLTSFQEVVRANEIRYKVGDIGMLELRQSRVEADRFRTDVTSARADASAAAENLSAPLGIRFVELFPGGVVDCELKREPLRSPLDELIRQALENRDDVRVARVTVENARDNLHLARANRWVDPTVNIGVTHTPQVQSVFDSAGNVTNSPTLASSTTLGLTVTIPIPFSRLQRGELVQAETAVTQAELQLRSTLLKAETEVRATHAQYRAAATNVQSYADHVLADADHVLDGKRTSYRKGAASLLELLDAQRTADDVHLGYLQALADLANATVRLQLSAGMRPEL